jgi:manganese-dependent inorganic pyrophosphatase
MTVHVVGHSNPDTDSVTSAISFAALLQAQGQDAQPCMQCGADGLNPETKVVLERFGLPTPAEISDAAGKQLALVDFSDLAQGPANLGEAEVVAVVDHHKIGDVTTNSPILFRARARRLYRNGTQQDVQGSRRRNSTKRGRRYVGGYLERYRQL